MQNYSKRASRAILNEESINFMIFLIALQQSQVAAYTMTLPIILIHIRIRQCSNLKEDPVLKQFKVSYASKTIMLAKRTI